MNDRTKAALRRFIKIALAAVLPVALAALQQYATTGSFDYRPTLIALATALLAGIEKGYNWKDIPDATSGQ